MPSAESSFSHMHKDISIGITITKVLYPLVTRVGYHRVYWAPEMSQEPLHAVSSGCGHGRDLESEGEYVIVLTA